MASSGSFVIRMELVPVSSATFRTSAVSVTNITWCGVNLEALYHVSLGFIELLVCTLPHVEQMPIGQAPGSAGPLPPVEQPECDFVEFFRLEFGEAPDGLEQYGFNYSHRKAWILYERWGKTAANYAD